MSNAAKWVVGIVVVALVVWGLMAANKNKNSPKQENKTESSIQLPAVIKMGSIQPMTGDAASFGEVFKNVMQLAIEEINNQDGMKGSKIELVIEDSKCNGKDATSAVQKLVNVDKVVFILGGLCSAETLAGVPIAQAGKVVMASNGSTNPKLTNISPYFFRLVPSDNEQGRMGAQLATKKGYKTIGFISEQTDYAEGLMGVFEEEFKKMGGAVVAEKFPQKATDFRTQLIKLKTQNPDALFINSTGSEPASRIIKQLKDLGWKPKILLNESIATDAQFLEANKDFLEGASGVEFKIDATNQKFKDLQVNYQKRFGSEIRFTNFAAATYDEVYLFAEGVKTVGYDGEKLAAWSRTIKNWPGATGAITIKPDGDTTASFNLAVVKAGKLEPYTE